MILVLSGTFDIGPGPDRFTLWAGDCIEYRSSIPHRIAIAAKSPAEVQWMISPVTSAKADLDAFVRKPVA